MSIHYLEHLLCAPPERLIETAAHNAAFNFRPPVIANPSRS
jgi:hypothetical protein